MRLPDRPALNVVLGVVLALVVLGFLSWPGIVGQKQAAHMFLPNNSLSASPAQSSASSVYSISSIPTSTQTMISTLSSSSTVTAAESSSSIPAPSNSVGASGFNISSSSLGSTNGPVPVSSLNNGTLPSFNSGPDTVAQQVQSTVTTVVRAVTTGIAYNFGNSSSSSSAPSLAGPSFSQQIIGNGVFSTLAILTLGAIIIAVGSMLFVYRKVDSEDSED